MRAQVVAHPGIRLEDRCERWHREQGVRASVATMSRVQGRFGITVAKNAPRQ